MGETTTTTTTYLDAEAHDQTTDGQVIELGRDGQCPTAWDEFTGDLAHGTVGLDVDGLLVFIDFEHVIQTGHIDLGHMAFVQRLLKGHG